MNKRKLKALYRTNLEDKQIIANMSCMLLAMILGAVLYLAILINNM